ncbi:thioesterase II family protein [Actinophytocola sp.]|uniref:thioesterase II family protein n=1 Tax=Actinophytocola sp. TaxID=1872138 RepID=UPI003D6ABD25
MPGDGWFLSDGATTRPDAPTVVCFAHAGGDPRAYLGWQRHLGPAATVRAVCVPGRGHRVGEPRTTSLDELADGAAEAIRGLPDRAVCLFGHSLGGLVAFEVARRLRDWPPLRHLVVSGCAAPSLLPTEYIVWAARLPWREFVEATAKHEGLAPEIVEDPELQELLLPELRADVRLFADYRYRPAASLTIEASLVNGADDWRVADGVLHPWEREFAAVPRYHWRDGGHFYFTDRPAAVVDILRDALRPMPAPATDHVEVI